MFLFGLGAALVSALLVVAVAGLAYLAYRLTVKVLRSYRRKKQTKLVMANMGALIKKVPNREKRTLSFDDLEEMEDETIVAEYDEDSGEVIHANFVGDKGMDNNIENALNRNHGVMFIED
ncbi:MAG: hypothetical protein ACLUFB_00195 [Ruminococcus sp.]|uniref:hypothetical protein n=1 Tax=Ruminococcus sp. TaxID=41978 RepID=UPI003991655D